MSQDNLVILRCTESGNKSVYYTRRNPKKVKATGEKLKLKKFNKVLGRHTIHEQVKKLK
jgi:ribosomal protein L33